MAVDDVSFTDCGLPKPRNCLPGEFRCQRQFCVSPDRVSSVRRWGAVLVWHGMVWYGMVWYGMVWYGMAWRGVAWHGMVWYGMVWYGMVWYGMVWYGMV